MINVHSIIHSARNSFGTHLGITSPFSISTSCTAIKNIVYEQTLFFAANNQAIIEKFHQYKNLTWVQRFKIGAVKGVEKVVIGVFSTTFLRFALSGMSSGKTASAEMPSILVGLAAAVLEEIQFRGILQNYLRGSYKIENYVPPKNRVVKWLTSPSARIITVNAVFAGLHFFNGGTYLSEKEALIQVIQIMLLPSQGILYETTGDLIAPIACHMTNNLIAIPLYKFLR